MTMSCTNKPTVYISCSIPDYKYITELADSVSALGGTPVYWKHGTEYDPSLLHNSDMILFFLPKVNNLTQMTRGMRTELMTSINANKPRFYSKYSTFGSAWNLDLGYDLQFQTRSLRITDAISTFGWKTISKDSICVTSNLTDEFQPPRDKPNKRFY